MTKNRIFRKAIKVTVFFIAFVIYHYGITLVTQNFQTDYLDVILTYVLYYVIALVAFYWSLGGNKSDKIKSFHVFKSIILFFIAWLFIFLYYYIFLPAIGRTYFKDSVGPVQFFWSSLETYITYFAYAFFYWHYKRSLRTERQLRLTEKARLEAEFNHLRTQINPHFLFNTLNTFYSQSLDTLPDTAKGISLLSKIMRYSLEPPGTDGKVPLEDEVAHANDYIELMEIRFPGRLKIQNNLPRETAPGWQILPHLLITLVENAFKHGNKEQPFLFDLQLDKGKDQIVFRVENTIGNRRADSSTGVGLRNVKERLLYTYGKSYTFQEEVVADKYITLMIIPDAFMAQPVETHRQKDPGFNFQFS